MRNKLYIQVFITTIFLAILNTFFLIRALLIAFPLEIHSNTSILEMSILEAFIVAVIIGPIVETLFFIAMPIRILEIKVNYFLIGFISCILFALSHYYSINYILLTFFEGVFLFSCFIFFYKIFNFKLAIICVSSIHIFNNSLLKPVIAYH